MDAGAGPRWPRAARRHCRDRRGPRRAFGKPAYTKVYARHPNGASHARGPVPIIFGSPRDASAGRAVPPTPTGSLPMKPSIKALWIVRGAVLVGIWIALGVIQALHRIA